MMPSVYVSERGRTGLVNFAGLSTLKLKLLDALAVLTLLIYSLVVIGLSAILLLMRFATVQRVTSALAGTGNYKDSTLKKCSEPEPISSCLNKNKIVYMAEWRSANKRKLPNSIEKNLSA